MTNGELDLLLSAFLATREGVHWGAGDISLVDNMRYGHSREAFEGQRSIGVAIAGGVETTPAIARGHIVSRCWSRSWLEGLTASGSGRDDGSQGPLFVRALRCGR